MAEVTADDITAAAAHWRKNADPKYKKLLDAEQEPAPQEPPAEEENGSTN